MSGDTGGVAPNTGNRDWVPVPTCADITGDGLLDCLFGTEEGALNYYENTGRRLTLNSPESGVLSAEC